MKSTSDLHPILFHMTRLCIVAFAGLTLFLTVGCTPDKTADSVGDTARDAADVIDDAADDAADAIDDVSK